MPATNPPRRIMVNADILEPSLRMVGYDPEQPMSLQVQECVESYADLIARAGAEVENELQPEEWNLIADVMNGCMDLNLYGGSAISASLLLASNVADGIRLDGLADKWLSDDDPQGTELLAKLRGLTELQSEAVLSAVRYFWVTPDQPKDWWLVKHRMPAKPARKGKRRQE